MRGSIITRKGVKNVSFQLRYELGLNADGSRKRGVKTICGGTKAEAQKELRKLLTQIDEGSYIDKSKITVSQWVDKWLTKYLIGVTVPTRENYSGVLRRYVNPRLGNMPLQTLSKGNILEMYAELAMEGRTVRAGQPVSGVSAQTVKHVHRVLFSCLKAAADNGLIRTNPLYGVPAPKANQSQTVTAAEIDDIEDSAIRWLELDDTKILRKVMIGHEHEVFFNVALSTGARRSELLSLKWRDIDFDNATLKISKAVTKTRAHGVAINTQPKNQSSNRTIGLDTLTLDILRAHQTSQKALALKVGKSYPSNCLVFPQVAPRGKGAMPLADTINDVDFNRLTDPNSVTKSFRLVADKAGFPHLRLHDLRHSHATLLLRQNIPVLEVAKRLGHANANITMAVYAHALQGKNQDVINAVELIMKAAFG